MLLSEALEETARGAEDMTAHGLAVEVLDALHEGAADFEREEGSQVGQNVSHLVGPRTRCLWAHEFENCDRVDLALNVALAKAATLKVLRDRTLGTLAEVDFARPGELLEAGGEVGRIAHGCVVHPKVIADLTDDHETRMQPHADRELHSVLSGQLPLPRRDRKSTRLNSSHTV